VSLAKALASSYFRGERAVTARRSPADARPPHCCDVEIVVRRVGDGFAIVCLHDPWCRWYQRRKAWTS
jgi:hypothetical protein